MKNGMSWLISGDCHRRLARFDAIKDMPASTKIILLGDVGLNYCLDQNDRDTKAALCRKYPFTFYCVRGNHEARPSDVPGMELVWDSGVSGMVWVEPEFPQIKYFKDFGIYWIDGYRTLVIGGAYSVDKYWRLQRGAAWFKNEQLSQKEMDECERLAMILPKFDLVLSHTCPRSCQPVDLFLGSIDQSSVDSSMEEWLDTLLPKLTYHAWLWGHYHADRIEAPHMEMFYQEIENLEDIMRRWRVYDETGELDWWLPTSGKMKRILGAEEIIEYKSE